MFGRGEKSVTLEEIKSKVSDSSLVSHYLGVEKIPCFIHSPLRQDNRPSFGIYSSDGETVRWVDMATGERGGVYDLLSRLWGCSFKETLHRIDNDYVSNNSIQIKKTTYNNIFHKTSNSNVTLECKVRNWEDYDIKYWESYGVPLKWLKYADVYPISHKIVVMDGIRKVFGADKYAYAYVERKEGKVTLKIYQPFNKQGRKWANKHDRSVISLWTKVPEYGDKIVICSSLKDALCFWANTGIPALAIQGEAYGMSDTAVNELKRRYKNVYILLDNYEQGLKDAEENKEKTGFTNIVLPQFEGGKDISDLYKIMGKEKFKEIVHSLI